ncbi:uncharacterized protein LOC143234919 [Tachypleus tridentatus]|uniref:uncharacterized protein LOC143234919 n=1 Tax=Tachypleus tridentatus TaxID=6853 RepID=UPI003FD2D740
MCHFYNLLLVQREAFRPTTPQGGSQISPVDSPDNPMWLCCKENTCLEFKVDSLSNHNRSKYSEPGDQSQLKVTSMLSCKSDVVILEMALSKMRIYTCLELQHKKLPFHLVHQYNLLPLLHPLLHFSILMSPHLDSQPLHLHSSQRL